MTRSYITEDRFIHWINLIRETNDSRNRYDMLEAFWGSQVKSKSWLIDQIKEIYKNNPEWEKSGVAYVFGGWHGFAAMLIIDHLPNIHTVYSLDKDPKCALYGNMLTNNDSRIKFKTYDMTVFSKEFYPDDIALIVNTSTEHLRQRGYDDWFANVKENTLLAVQGNNYREVTDHVRHSENLNMFISQNHIDNILYKGELDCVQFTRYMCIGYRS